MDHYLEIALLPDPEFPPPVLMNTLFGKLHQALARLGSGAIGVSFPDLDQERPSLGGRLRVHGSGQDLAGLVGTGWLNGLSDHTHIAAVRPVPAKLSYVVVRRRQAKSNVERLRRRWAKRHEASFEEAKEVIPDQAEQRLALPFVTLRSGSTGNTFRLFIEQGEPLPNAVAGEFSHYGLSSKATVPWF